jgi:metallo-beta-lactamase family protein
MALQSTRIYQKYLKFLNKEAQDFYRENEELFHFDSLQVMETSRESREIENHHEPCIIISSSGMITGGRIEQHLRNNISNSYATILMIGFSAQGTLGNQLMQNPKFLKIQGKEFPVNAEIRQTDIFSGHGDLDDLMDFVHYQDKTKLKQLFIVHGDISSMENFQQTLHDDGYTMASMPEYGSSYEL